MTMNVDTCIDDLLDHGTLLLKTVLTMIRSGSSSPPTTTRISELCSVTSELQRATDRRLAEKLVDEGQQATNTVATTKNALSNNFDLGNLNALQTEIQQLADTVHDQLSAWKHQARGVRVDIAHLRTVVADECDTEGIARKALVYCRSQLLSCCLAASCSTVESHEQSNNNTARHAEDGEDLRNPIFTASSESAGDFFPFQHLLAADVAAISPIWEWLLHAFPKSARHGVGVLYHPADLRQMLLKCIVYIDAQLDNECVVHAQLVHMTRFCMVHLRRGNANGGDSMQERDVLHCVATAITTLFLYTVNLDGHYIDITTKKPLSVEQSLDLLKTIEWPRQKGNKTGPKLPPESVAIKVPCTSNAPPNSKAHGFNPAIWAVTNWSLRVSGDPAASATVRHDARIGANVFRNFAEHLAWALSLLPPTACTVYRGIKGRTTRPYVQNTTVAWPAFSSTSTKDKEALGFMGKEQGTFFIVHCSTARDIAFCSWYPLQAELLLPPARSFKVQSRVSNTVLTMLESKAELIVMREQSHRGGTDIRNEKGVTQEEGALEVVVDQAIDAVSRTVFIFDAFMQKYVPGRFSSKQGNVEEEHTMSVEMFASSLLGPHPSKQRTQRNAVGVVQRGTTIVGDGGTGKTSAMLYLLSSIARNPDSGAVPVLVPLPALRLWNSQTQAPTVAPIDAFVCDALGLESPEQLIVLAKKRNLVVLLDSLDEVVPEHREHLHQSLTKNPLINQHAAKIILSTRSEALQDARQLLAGIPASTWYCLPFTTADTRMMLRTRVKALRKRNDDNDDNVDIQAVVDGVWKQLESWHVLPVLSNPFVASMCIETVLANGASLPDAHRKLSDISWHDMKEITVYEAYLQHNLSAAGGRAENAGPHFQQATAIATHLTSMLTSHASIGDLGMSIERISAILRYESLEPGSSASFRHKSLQEYLVARAICAELSVAQSPLTSAGDLLQSLPRLSNVFPNIIRLAASLLLSNGERFHNATAALADIIVQTSPCVPCGGGTALSLLVRTGHPLKHLLRFAPNGLAGVITQDANLDSASFAGISLDNATLRGCILSNCNFDGTSVNAATIVDCEFGELPAITTHTDVVDCVSMSPDGTLVASCSRDKTTRIHRVETGALVSTFRSDNNDISVSFSPDGELLGCGGHEGQLKVYRVEDSTQILCVSTPETIVISLGFSPEGKRIAFTTMLAEVKVINVTNGEEISNFTGHKQYCTSVAFSPDGTLLASGGLDSNVKLHTADNAEQVSTLLSSNDDGTVEQIAFSPVDENLVAAAYSGGNVKLFSSRGAQELATLSPHANRPVLSLAFSFDGKLLATGGGDGMVKTCRLDTHEEVSSFASHTGPVRSVCFSPCKTRIVSGSNDHTVKIHQLDTSGNGGAAAGIASRFPGVGQAQSISAISFSPKNEQLVAVAAGNCVFFFRTDTGEQVSCRHRSEAYVNSLAFTPDGQMFVSGDTNGVVRVERVETDEIVHQYRHQECVNSVAVSCDGLFVASGAFDQSLIIFRMDIAEQICNFKNDSLVANVVISPGNLVAFTSSEGINLFSTETEKKVQHGSPFGSAEATGVRSLCISPDGALIASGTLEDGLVRCHRVETGEELFSVAVHSDDVSAVAFSPNGKLLVSGCADGTVSIHHLRHDPFVGSASATNHHHKPTRLEKVFSYKHTNSVSSLSFSPNGDRIASSGGSDLTIRMFAINDNGHNVASTSSESCAFVHFDEVLSISQFRKSSFENVQGVLNERSSDGPAAALLKRHKKGKEGQ